jgi:hypothetical protein
MRRQSTGDRIETVFRRLERRPTANRDRLREQPAGRRTDETRQQFGRVVPKQRP